MMQIERIKVGRRGKGSKYQIVSIGKERNVIATLDSLEKAACVLRFIHGSTIKGEEYRLAVDTLREIDAEGVFDEMLSGEIDLRISDGSSSD